MSIETQRLSLCHSKRRLFTSTVPCPTKTFNIKCFASARSAMPPADREMVELVTNFANIGQVYGGKFQIGDRIYHGAEVQKLQEYS